MLFYSSPSVEIGAGSGFSVSVLVLSSAANNIEEKTIEKIKRESNIINSPLQKLSSCKQNYLAFFGLPLDSFFF
jgi:hypothetical protein